MEEDSSDSSDSYHSSDSEREYKERRKSPEPESYDTFEKLSSFVPKTIKSTKIVISSETKSKLEELKEVEEKQKSVEESKTAEKKKEVSNIEEKEENKSTEKDKTSSVTNIDKIESKTIKDNTESTTNEEKLETTTNEEKCESTTDEDKIELKTSKEESKPSEDSSEEELEFEDEDPSQPKQKKQSKKASKTTEYDPKNVHYEGDLAIYTDPKSGYQYKWCGETNQWLSKSDVTYGFEDDVHTYTDTEGVKYFWDVDRNAWFPKIDDDFMARYQMSYGFVDNEKKDSQKIEEKDNEDAEEKEKKPEKKTEADQGVKRKLEQPLPSWFEMSDQQNTKVYVSNLPTDITEQEFVDLMQKCGLVMRDLQTGKMKVKLYTVPDTDILKGDGLCTYIKIESVELALNLLDGYDHRGKKIKVERAKFEMKGEFNPTLKPKKRRRKDKDKLKKMQEKLFDWRPEKMRGERSKHERIVIIKNLFEPALFDEDVSLILEYQQDLREECSKCGEVKRVLLYDRHPEGVAQITMKDPEQADEVVTLLNGRWFGKRQLTAHIWDGKTKYKIAETDSEITQRLSEWDKFLESDEATKTAAGKTKEKETNEPATDTNKTKEKETSEPALDTTLKT